MASRVQKGDPSGGAGAALLTAPSTPCGAPCERVEEPETPVVNCPGAPLCGSELRRSNALRDAWEASQIPADEGVINLEAPPTQADEGEINLDASDDEEPAHNDTTNEIQTSASAVGASCIWREPIRHSRPAHTSSGWTPGFGSASCSTSRPTSALIDNSVQATTSERPSKRLKTIVKSRTSVNQAVAELQAKAYTGHSRATNTSKLATWDGAARKLGYSGIGLDVDKMEKVAAVMVKAGYRTTWNYLLAAMKRTRRLGGTITPDMQEKALDIKRASLRGLGPPRKTQTLPLEPAVTAAAASPWTGAGAPILQPEVIVVCTWWMMREIDLERVTLNQVSHHNNRVAGITFRIQKTDTQGIGETVYFECICGEIEGTKATCPTCALSTLHKARAGAPLDGPLVVDSEGLGITKVNIIKMIEHFATTLGLPLLDESGRNRFGGHAFRGGGAQVLAEIGVKRETIKTLGRWASDVALDRYLRGAPRRRVFGEIKEALNNIQVVPGAVCATGLVRTPARKHTRYAKKTNEPRMGEIKELIENTVARSLGRASESSDSLRCADPLPPPVVAGGKVHKTARADVRQPISTWETLCGWKFGLAGHAAWKGVSGDDALTCSKCASKCS